ncbi:MAG: hypothetical protein H6627_04980 [Calditrichae bacterium]|nr:hypothetical protein [Calditrichia bacterium]
MKLIVFIKDTLKLITVVYMVFTLSGIYNTVAAIAQTIDQHKIESNTDNSCTCGCNMKSIEDCSCCKAQTSQIDETNISCGCAVEKSDSCMPHEKISGLSGTSDFILNFKSSRKSFCEKTDYLVTYTKNYFVKGDSVYHPPSVFLS